MRSFYRSIVMANKKQKIINAAYNSLYAVGDFAGLFYLTFSIFNRVNNDDDNDDFAYWILVPSLLLALYGAAITAYFNWSFNADIIEQNLGADEKTTLLTEDENNHSKAFQMFILSSSLAVGFGDFNSLILTGIIWLNSLLGTKIPTVLTLPVATVMFLTFSPSLLPKLATIAPDLIKNKLTLFMAKHPNAFRNISVISESAYDCSSALVAIPAAVFLTLLELSMSITLILILTALFISYLAMSTENYLFEGKNLKNTLLNISKDSCITTVDEAKIILPAYKAYPSKAALVISLGIVSLMFARPFNSILSLTNLSLELRAGIILAITVVAGYCHLNVATKSALDRIEITPSQSGLKSNALACCSWLGDHCKTMVDTNPSSVLDAPEYELKV